MTSLSKIRLAKLSESDNDQILLKDLKTISYDIYSKKSSKQFLSVVIEQNDFNNFNFPSLFEVNRNNSFLTLPLNNSKNEEEKIQYIKELKKKEIALKFLKPLTSRISKITLKFEKKQFREAWKVAPLIAKMDEIQDNSETSEMVKRDLFLIETRLAKKWTGLDYEIMESDLKVLEWQRNEYI